MLNRIIIVLLLLTGIVFLSSCFNIFERQNIKAIGLISVGSMDSSDWEETGYKSLHTIGERYNANVHFKEEIRTKLETTNAVDELAKKGVNLIFGSDNMYGRHFHEIAKDYPEIHFVYFNGGYTSDNLTSLTFDSHAMGFFSGMIASKMTGTNNVGIIAAYEWQSEIEGFYEGAKFQNPETKVHIDFVNSFGNKLPDTKNAVTGIYDDMVDHNVDVIYSAGQFFSTEVIERASQDDLYIIGYTSDHSYTNDSTVLTSTIQHVDLLYSYAAEEFNNQTLSGEIITFDFQDGAITLTEFNEDIPKSYQMKIHTYIEAYIETGLLPNEK